MNVVHLVGRVGGDAEARQVTPEWEVATFNVATSTRYKTKDGESAENTEWHRVQASATLVPFVKEYIKKGMLVQVTGKLKTTKTQDKYYTRVDVGVGDSIQVLEWKKDDDLYSIRPSDEAMKYDPY